MDEADFNTSNSGIAECAGQCSAAVEEAMDVDSSNPTSSPRYWYHGQHPDAGQALHPAPTSFEMIHDSEVLKIGEVLGPFKDDNEWQLAKWLMKNVSHSAADDFLKLPIIR